MQPYVTINHDAFGRYSVIRRLSHTVTYTKHSCAWCGQPARFQYGYENDDDNRWPGFMDKHFCCVDCFRTYYGA